MIIDVTENILTINMLCWFYNKLEITVNDPEWSEIIRSKNMRLPYNVIKEIKKIVGNISMLEVSGIRDTEYNTFTIQKRRDGKFHVQISELSKKGKKEFLE